MSAVRFGAAYPDHRSLPVSVTRVESPEALRSGTSRHAWSSSPNCTPAGWWCASYVGATDGSHRVQTLPDSLTATSGICRGGRLSTRLSQTCPGPLSVPGGQGIAGATGTGNRPADQGSVSSNRSSNANKRPRMSPDQPDHAIPAEPEDPDW